jgi:hypothetical protein
MARTDYIAHFRTTSRRPEETPGVEIINALSDAVEEVLWREQILEWYNHQYRATWIPRAFSKQINSSRLASRAKSANFTDDQRTGQVLRD